jgi:hypothetical protein
VSRTVFDISLALDGFVTAAPQTAAEPLGPGGEQRHGWLVDRDYLERAVADLGAVVAGRTTLPGRPSRTMTADDAFDRELTLLPLSS